MQDRIYGPINQDIGLQLMKAYLMNKTPHTTKFIALSGKKQTGKDSAANMIKRYLETQGKTVVLSAFAEPLKRMCIDILGLKESEVYGTDEDKNKPSHIQWDGFPEDIRLKYSNQYILANDGVKDPLPIVGHMTNREVLQVMGTDIFRSIYGDVWARAPFNRKWQQDIVIFTDARFPNEIQATEENHGVIIRLERKTGLNDNHASETALDGHEFKYKYQNDGSLAELEKFVISVCDTEGF